MTKQQLLARKAEALRRAQRRAEANAPAIPEPAPIPKPAGPPWYTSVTAVAALFFACVVAIVWGAYGPHTGLPFETAFTYNSETTTPLRGFLYYADAMRIHTNTFYHLSYLIGEALGIRGSYVPYQVVYALLWWARAMLVFLILRKFLPENPSLCYAGGVLALLHASDGAMMLVEQMNQYGFIFWMLLAMYVYIWAWDARRWWIGGPLALLAAAFEYMSLWSYESPIVLILAFPLGLMLARRQWLKPGRLLTWYSVPGYYLALTYVHYTHAAGQTYQETVLRKSWSVTSIAGDWAFNIVASLKFWAWSSDWGWKTPRSHAYVLATLVAVVFAAGWMAVIRLGRDRERPNPFAVSIRSCVTLLAAGFVASALSFPVYLLLNTARGLWRTQFLSGMGSGIMMAAVLGLISFIPLGKYGRIAVVLTAGATIAFWGSVAALERGGVHRSDWERHRHAMLEVLKFAPTLPPETVVVMTNVPKNDDPFYDDLWFDLGLRLMYPGVPVAGVYYYSDGTAAPGDNMVLEGDAWRWDGQGFGHVFTTTPLAKTIVVEYHRGQAGKLLETLPPFLCRTSCKAELYAPWAAVGGGPVSPIAARRFGAGHP